MLKKKKTHTSEEKVKKKQKNKQACTSFTYKSQSDGGNKGTVRAHGKTHCTTLTPKDTQTPSHPSPPHTVTSDL